MTLRLRFWLAVMDLAHRFRSLRFYLWAVSRASDAADWDDTSDWPEEFGDGAPF